MLRVRINRGREKRELIVWEKLVFAINEKSVALLRRDRGRVFAEIEGVLILNVGAIVTSLVRGGRRIDQDQIETGIAECFRWPAA